MSFTTCLNDRLFVQMHDVSQGLSILSSDQSQFRPETLKDLPETPSMEEDRPIEIIDDDVDYAPRTQVEWQEPTSIAGSSTIHRAKPLNYKVIAKIRDSLYKAQNGCPLRCRCRCHFNKSEVSTRSWLQRSFVSLSVSHNALPSLRKRPCTERGCKRWGRVTLTLEHEFPRWLRAGVFAFKASYDTFSGVKCSGSLRPTRELESDDEVWFILEAENDGLVDFIRNNPHYFPDDSHADGQGLVEYAMDLGAFDALELLLRIWENILPKKGLPMNVAFLANETLEAGLELDDREVNLLLQARKWADDGLECTTTKVHQATAKGESLVTALQEEPWVINALDHTGSAPIHVAVQLNQAAAFEELIGAKADINLANWHRWTPLMLAVHYDDLEMVERLLQAKCCVGLQANRGETALHLAMARASPDIVAMLMVAGASASVRDGNGESPLHGLAESRTSQEIAEEKLRYLRMANHFDLEATDLWGNTPMMRAVMENNLPVLRCLVGAGASLDHVNSRTQNILHIAAFYCNTEVLHYLTGLALSGISTHLDESHRCSPWDMFQFVIHAETWKLGSYRRPDADEKKAFAQLYEDVRNRNLQHDIQILEEVAKALRKDEKVNSRAALAPLIKQMEEWNREGLIKMFRAIDSQIRVGELLLAIGAIEDYIEEIREEMGTSAWDQWSYWKI
ncbi:Fc.00g041710.m01.CDS01 [Cosmosporella sp. VM-42]